MSRKYEPSSEPPHISAKHSFLQESFEAEVFKLCDMGANGTNALWEFAKPYAEKNGVTWENWTVSWEWDASWAGPNTTWLEAECRCIPPPLVPISWRPSNEPAAGSWGRQWCVCLETASIPPNSP